LLQCECPLLALSGHARGAEQCLLSASKRTWPINDATPAYDSAAIGSFSAVLCTHRPNLVYRCCPAGLYRHKALRRRLVRCERVRIDRGSESRRQPKLSSHGPQWLREQAYIRFQKSVKLAGIANGDARDTGLHPTPKVPRQTVAEYRFHSPFVNRIERLAKQIEAAKTLELELAEAHVRNCGGTLHIGKFADRLVQHHWNKRRARYSCVCLPVLGPAWLLEQVNAGRVGCPGGTTRIPLPRDAIGGKAHRRAAGDRPLDELDATRVVLR